MSLPDLTALLRALAEADLEFVVVGGVAVAAHGFVRATEDVDLVPNPAPRNLDELVNTLLRLESRLTQRPDQPLGQAERQALHQGRNLSVTTRLGDLDILVRMPGVPSFDVLSRDAAVVALAGTSLSVCSREHLIAMKRARSSAADLADLERLEDPACAS